MRFDLCLQLFVTTNSLSNGSFLLKIKNQVILRSKAPQARGMDVPRGGAPSTLSYVFTFHSHAKCTEVMYSQCPIISIHISVELVRKSAYLSYRPYLAVMHCVQIQICYANYYILLYKIATRKTSSLRRHGLVLDSSKLPTYHKLA